MDRTTLNERRAKMYESSQPNGQRKFVVQIPGLNCVFAKKADANQYRLLYNQATKNKAC